MRFLTGTELKTDCDSDSASHLTSRLSFVLHGARNTDLTSASSVHRARLPRPFISEATEHEIFSPHDLEEKIISEVEKVGVVLRPCAHAARVHSADRKLVPVPPGLGYLLHEQYVFASQAGVEVALTVWFSCRKAVGRVTAAYLSLATHDALWMGAAKVEPSTRRRARRGQSERAAWGDIEEGRVLPPGTGREVPVAAWCHKGVSGVREWQERGSAKVGERVFDVRV
ncbi:hypothetical protein L226DRAFT_389666 [Lentinus tigrinus ALCF2SS1-7]|uniref:uncharacterized protein n=1 Tax=Lentinus tigrinus ALCF2SS1-7 TaxID=1328758 RepID=UPI00116602D4|nr:hypothetical protein L226DRAFT_389666 [Lentinus tigrinus ALCF2SS1-7]